MDIEMANHTVFNMDNDEHIIEDINGFWEANSESESESSLDCLLYTSPSPRDS